MSKLILSATVEDKTVYVSVTDLTAFVHAGPNEMVCVSADEGQTFVQKGTMEDIEVHSFEE